MIKWLVLTVLFCFAVILGLGWFLIFTETGLQVAAGLATRVPGLSFSVGSSEGRVAGNWLLRDVIVNTDAADIRIEKISCDWQPRRLMEKNLHIADLTIGGVRITIKGGKPDDDVDKDSFTLPSVVLPMPFLVGQLLVDDVAVVDAEENPLFDARSLSARLSGVGNHIDISDVLLDAPYAGVTGDAQLVMSGKWPLTMSADWWVRVEGCTRFGGSFTSAGTLSDPVMHVVLVEPDALQIDVDIVGLFDEIAYRASVSGSDLTLSRFCMQTPGEVDDLQAEISGDLENYRGSAQAAMVFDNDPPVSAQIDFSGNREKLTIDSGHIIHGSNRIDATGSLIFGAGLGLNAVIRTQMFDISELLPIPETLIDGTFDIYGEIAGDRISYLADLRELGITIRDHNMKIGGGLSLHGDQHGLEITQSSFVCGEGTIGIQGNVNWRDNLVWEADILLDSFNPAVIEVLPEGSISGSLSSTGSIVDSQLAIQAEIASLSGEVSGYELAGEGLIVYRDQILSVKDLHITNGSNSIQAEGDIGADYNLAFQFHGSELERVFPLLNGSLEVGGAMKGNRSKPVLSVKARGRNLSYREFGLDELLAEAVVDLGGKSIQGDFEFARISSGDMQAEHLAVDVNGSLAGHTVSGVLTVPRGTLSIQAHGAFPDADPSIWHGAVDRLEVKDDAFGVWTSGDPIRIEAGVGSVTVDDACLLSDNNRLCADIDWEPDGWSAAVNDVRFDLGSLNRWGLLEKPLTGTVEGKASAHGAAAEVTSAEGLFAVESVQWDPGPNSYYQDFSWFDTSCSFKLVDQDLMVELSTRFVDGSTLHGQIGLAGVSDFTDVRQIPVVGEIDLDLRNLKPLSVVTAEFLIPEGHAAGTVDIRGTLAEPRFLGDVKLLDGGFHIPFLGIDLTDVHGTVELDGRRLNLDLDSRSGDGRLNSAGNFYFGAEDWSGHLGFTGSNSSLLNRRAISADANPDLELKLGPDGGSLTGAVEVLRALVEVEKIDRSATESSDVVFVDKEAESASWPFFYDIEVTLGDDVNVEGFGLTGKLGGNLKVANNADGTTTGRGFLDVREGSFVVYGSPLTISRGRLSFDGGPVDNPGIDIKASKIIDENRSGYEKIEVGANVIGSAVDFDVELYSVPSMEKSDILTYILFDNPFSSEGDDGTTGLITSAARALGFGKGSDLLGDVNSILPVDQIRLEGGLDKQETSLVVGKNLSKELSVSYDYNLFKNAGSFRVRYEFGKGFSVESRNSFESNAVELMYSFER